jgi:hypothetical protein
MNSTSPSDERGSVVGLPENTGLDAAELFGIHAELTLAKETLLEVSRKVDVLFSQKHSDVAMLTDWERRFEEQVREARGNVEMLGTALDRIKLVALNTGLEGARLGDLAGKVLVGVSDELRQLASRGLELLLEQASVIERLETERKQLLQTIERSNQRVITLTDLHELTERLEEQGHHSIERLAVELERGTGLDVEAQARVTVATEQAKGLVSTLVALEKPEQRRIAREAILTELGQVLRFLSTEPPTASE